MGNRTNRPFPYRTLAMGAVVYVGIQACFVGIAGVFGSSEARELQVVDIILRTNEWILPLRNGLIPSKPPLYHWLVSLMSLPFGRVDTWAGRITSHGAASITLLCVAYIAYRLSILLRTYQSDFHGERTAIIAAGSLSLTYGFFQMGAQAMVDMTFCMCVWLALMALVCGIRDESSKAFPRISSSGRTFFWFFSFLGVLARGPLGFILPCCIAFVGGIVAVGFKKTLREFVRPSIGWVFLGLPVCWYYAAFQVGGQSFLDRQLLFKNIQRFAGGQHVNSEAWWFYIPSLLRTSFPWGLLVVVLAIVDLFSKRKVAYESHSRTLPWVSSIIAGVVVVLMSFSSGKRHSYMLPVLPLIAVQFAVQFSTLLDAGGATFRAKCDVLLRRLERTLEGLLVVLLVLGFVAIADVSVPYPKLGEALGAMKTYGSRGVPIIMLILGGTFMCRRIDLTARGKLVWLRALIVLTLATSAGTAVKAHFKGFWEMSQVWKSTAVADEDFVVVKEPYDEYYDPILFYMGREVALIQSPEDPRFCMNGTVYLARRRWLELNQVMIHGSVIEVTRLRERLASLRNDTTRELVVFRCRPSAHASEALQTAAVLAKNELL